MEDKKKKGDAGDSDAAAVLGATYEAVKPEDKDMGKWRQKLTTRDEKLNYLRSSEKY